MKTGFTLFVILAVTAQCSRDDSRTSDMQRADSARLISKHRELENVIRDYYFSIEEGVKKDLGDSEAGIIERVQSLINNGYVERPAILIFTDDGPRWVRVDYSTYKEYMTDHAIISRKFHGIQPN